MAIDRAIRKAIDGISDFLRLESAGGLLLAATAVLALICSNTPLDQTYENLLQTPAEMRFGSFAIAKRLPLWIDDGLMAIFFLLVGLEVKRDAIVRFPDLRRACHSPRYTEPANRSNVWSRSC